LRLIGLTGGTGSGKSTAARRFGARGLPVVDADRIGHELLEPGGAAERAVVEAFGEGITTSGIIDRAKLGAKVFGQPALLAQLNALVHPPLIMEVARRCQAHGAQGAQAVIIDAALLGEKGEKDPWLEDIILVSAPPELRIARLVQGRGISEETARQRVRVQTDPESKRPFCRWVIDNSGDLDRLHAQVDAIAEEIFAGSGTTV
jgi:dephospho-CoA kinase